MRICESFPMMPGTLELAVVVNVKAQRLPEATRNINDDPNANYHTPLRVKDDKCELWRSGLNHVIDLTLHGS